MRIRTRTWARRATTHANW